MVLRDDSSANNIERCRDGVANGTSNSTTQKVANVGVVLENCDVSPGTVELIVGSKLPQTVENAEKLSGNVALPQAMPSFIAKDREQSLKSSRVAGPGDSRNRLDLKLQSNF